MHKTCVICKGRGSLMLKGQKVICSNCKGEGFIHINDNEEKEE